jgi:membrane-bound lytic murein transglycosylase B
VPLFLRLRIGVWLCAFGLLAGSVHAAAHTDPNPAPPTAPFPPAPNALPDATTRAADFAAWREQLRLDALNRGISQYTFDLALAEFQPILRVIELDQRQPEFVDTFWNYLDRRIDARRLVQAHAHLREQKTLLKQIQARYGIPPQLLVSFWGMETNFGKTTGSFQVPHALATLAWDNRRSAFFRNELLNALSILEQEHVTLDDMKGSWAGAMGQMQFMPSTFLNYGVDADGDGRKDLWQSLPDAFHSAANYLNRIGWRADEIWGREVMLPNGFDCEAARLDNRKPLREWSRLGVRQADGKPLSKAAISGAIVLPQGHDGPAFLVYRNFDVIMQWNRSINYALAISHLADRLNGAGPIKLGRNADNRRLTRDQLMEIQFLLGNLGFDPGDIDGVPGSKTRLAIRAFQKSAGLPVDGHASASLLEYMQKAAPAGA